MPKAFGNLAAVQPHGDHPRLLFDLSDHSRVQLFSDPRFIHAVLREHDNKYLAVFEPFLEDLVNEAVAQIDLPERRPGIDTLRAQPRGERFCGTHVAGVADERFGGGGEVKRAGDAEISDIFRFSKIQRVQRNGLVVDLNGFKIRNHIYCLIIPFGVASHSKGSAVRAIAHRL